MRLLPCLSFATALLATQVEAQTLLGAEFTARNTIQVSEPLATNFGIPADTEVDFVPTTGPFVVTSGTDPELDAFATVYDINFDADSLVFTFDPTPDSQVPPRVLEAGTIDRYYFEFTFADASTKITGVGFDAAGSSIDPTATATPTINLLSDTSFFVEIGPGNGVLPGFVHAYDITVVPEPASLAFVSLAGGALLVSRKRDRKNQAAR